jgi:hypothetical protein
MVNLYKNLSQIEKRPNSIITLKYNNYTRIIPGSALNKPNNRGDIMKKITLVFCLVCLFFLTCKEKYYTVNVDNQGNLAVFTFAGKEFTMDDFSFKPLGTYKKGNYAWKLEFFWFSDSLCGEQYVDRDGTFEIGHCYCRWKSQ